MRIPESFFIHSQFEFCKNSTSIKEMTSSLPKRINLLLIGKTGNGKSALGNSILRRTIFRSVSTTTSVTTSIEHEDTELDGRKIRVVDGPGVGDTRVDNEIATELVIMATSDAMRANPEGFHALLLVVRFGRFTKEDRDTVEFLKKIFGQNSVRKHSILVITCGDEFERESEETGETFEEWCAAQTGVFQDLLEECGHRVVLFENKTEDERKKDRQLKGLMQMVDRLDNLYSDDEFTRAINGRTRLLIEARKSNISEHTRAEINKIRSQLEQFQPRKNKNKQMCQLDVFYLRAEEVLETVQDKDANFGILQDVIEDAKLLKSEIQARIHLLEINY
ncbi:Immune-associated nucleotide-binding protein 9 [Bulinus truncatus]|nr:Immune-associated nucleotide-binding protein 9 [Bulinus truncatus]